MSEIKGATLALFIFITLLFPLLLSTGLSSLHQHAFIKTTTEFSEIVKREGGVTEQVNNIAESLEEKGYTITFSNENGNQLTSAEYGDTIIVSYQYVYPNVRGQETLTSQTVIPILSR